MFRKRFSWAELLAGPGGPVSDRVMPVHDASYFRRKFLKKDPPGTWVEPKLDASGYPIKGVFRLRWVGGKAQ